MRIGVVGCGCVGSALKFAFEKLGHTVYPHDLKLGTKLKDVLNSEITFICVPTPSNPDGSCDTSIVKTVVKELMEFQYGGVIAIKSTVTPGTTSELIKRHNNPRICFVPEFLRERCALTDMIENNKLLAVGTNEILVYEIVEKSHGKYPKTHVMLTPTQAELLKNFHNALAGLRIIFANEMYEVCKAMNEQYTPMKEALLVSSEMEDIYLDCNENMRGYGGTCLPKDIKSMRHLVETLGVDAKLFETIDERNKRLKVTVMPGMRGGMMG